MKTYYIYILTEKGTDNVIYVGVSKNPHKRSHDHKYAAQAQTHHIHKYIIDAGIQVELTVIDEIKCEARAYSSELEGYWIGQFRAWGFPIRNIYTLQARAIPKKYQALNRPRATANYL